MTTYIALLRGINVGGHKRIKMVELKNLFETMELTCVKTYIQSGNILFQSEEVENLLCQRIEQGIKETFGFTVTVILRTGTEYEKVVRNCPFNLDDLTEGESIHCAFLDEAPSEEGKSLLEPFKNDKDEYKIVGKHIYLFLRQSILDSKLANQLPKIGIPMTIRNWKTVTKIAKMAEAISD